MSSASDDGSNRGAIEGLSAMMARMADQMNQMDERNQRRMDHLEQLQHSLQVTPRPTPAPTPNSRAAATAPDMPTKIHGRLVEFSGDRNVFRAWKDQVEIKITDDYTHCSESVKYGSVYQSLRGEAASRIASWARTQPAYQKTWTNIVNQLAYAYDDPDIQANAVNKLQRLRQGNRSVNAYVAELMTLLVDAGVTDDTQKKLYLTGGLKDAHKKKVDNSPWVFREADFDRCVELCRSFDLQNTLPQATPTNPAGPRDVDAMDWTPTVAAGYAGQGQTYPNGQGRQNRNNSQGNRFLPHPDAPRARWVSRDEILRRREQWLCIRCGSSEHRTGMCPYQPAQRPGGNGRNGRPGNTSGNGGRPNRPSAPMLEVAATTTAPPPQLTPPASPLTLDSSENE